jgi:hypothetical protein
MRAFKIKTVVEIEEKTIANLLCSAREGGANYWATFEQCPYTLHGGTLCLPVSVLEEEEDFTTKPHTLDLATVKRGLSLMAARAPQAFADILSGDDDSGTADVFLQYALLGEIVYG